MGGGRPPSVAVKKIATLALRDEQAVRDVLCGELGKLYRIAEISPEDFWARAQVQWRTSLDAVQLAQIWNEAYLPIPGTFAILQELRAQYYALYFLSDNVADRVEYLDTLYQFLRNFKAGVFSHLSKKVKPDPRIYGEALALTGCRAEECVYIDDKKHLLDPAKELGMHVVHFTDPETLRVELGRLGVRLDVP